MLFIDVDEYLEFTDKNMSIKTYLNMSNFDKCDVVRIHWLIYNDNNLVYYDERPIMERLIILFFLANGINFIKQ